GLCHRARRAPPRSLARLDGPGGCMRIRYTGSSTGELTIHDGDIVVGGGGAFCVSGYRGASPGGLTIHDGDIVVIGRGADCAIRTDDPMTSRHHARITRKGGTVTIDDLGSA